jgi:hypothetical protein
VCVCVVVVVTKIEFPACGRNSEPAVAVDHRYSAGF